MKKEEMQIFKEGENEYLLFGKYPYDENGGIKPIKWRVLDYYTDKLLLISEYGLDAIPYNEEAEDIFWKDCTLRNWLNGEFLNTAFNPEEQNAIHNSKVQEAYPDENFDEITRDKIFLLALSDVNEFFKSDDDRICKATPYSAKQANTDDEGNCDWWIRQHGCFKARNCAIHQGGIFNHIGAAVNNTGICIRPALVINLE